MTRKIWRLARHIATTSVVALACAASPAMSQDESGGQGPNVAEAGQATGQAGEILVTARRREERLQEVPVSVTALGADSLARQQIATEHDLQRAVPGLVVKSFGSRGNFNFALRGQAVDFVSGSQPAVLPYVDEFQTTAIGTSAYYDLQSIQVVRGPQGTLFGRNTTGGAVLLTTQAPILGRLEGFVKVGYGNYDTSTAQGAFNLPLGDRAAIRLAGDYKHQDGYVKNLLGPDLNGTNRYSLRGSLLWEASEGITNTLVGEYTKAHNNGDANINDNIYPVGGIGPAPYNFPLTALAATFYTRFIDTALGFPGAYEKLVASLPANSGAGLNCDIVCYSALQKERGPWKVAVNTPLSRPDLGLSSRSWGAYGINTTTFELSDGLTLKNIIGYSESRNGDNYDIDGTPFQLAGNFYGTKNQNFSEELQLSGKAMDDHFSYVMGFYYYWEKKKLDNTYVALSLGPDLDALAGLPVSGTARGTQRSKSQSAYFNGEYTFSGSLDRLTISAGVRYAWEQIRAVDTIGHPPRFPLPGTVEQRKDDNPSWQLGLRYKVSDDLMVYANHRGSWRSGGFNLTAAPVPSIGTEGGNMFLPEKTHDIEAGLKYAGNGLGFPMSIDVAVYNQWVDNIQRVTNIFLPDGTPAVITYNVPKGAQFRGVELQTSFAPARWLEFGINGAYTKGVYGASEPANLFGTLVVFDAFADLAKWSGSAYGQISFDLSHDEEKLSLRADAYTQSKQAYANALSTNPNAYIPSYTLVNLSVQWDNVAGSNLTASAFVSNLTKEEYYIGGSPHGSNFGANDRVPGTPRFYGVELRYDF